MSVTAVVVLVLSVVAACQGNTFKVGACPRVTVMERMDFDKFLGEWYVIQRFNPMATCTKIKIQNTPEGVYTVNETSRPFGLNFGFHQRYLNERRIHFLKDDSKSMFWVERSPTHFTLSTYGVIATDYDNYAVLWGCDSVLVGSIQNVDILARKPLPDPEVLKSARDALKTQVIDYQPLDFVDQVHCTESESILPSEDNSATNNMVIG